MEIEIYIYIVIECVCFLEGVLRDWEIGGVFVLGVGRVKGKENWIGWGVRSVLVSLF